MPNTTAKFYYRSYIDQDLDGYEIDGDYLNSFNVNDRRKDTYAETDSTGSADGTSEEIIADMLTEREIDTIFLKSNLKTFTIYYWEEDATGTGGDDWTEITNYAANTDEFLVISFTEVSTKKIKIAATHTITADEDKRIYLLDITKYINEINLESIDVEQIHQREDFTNLYGGSVQVVKYPNRGQVEINLGWDNMQPTDYAVYAELKALFLIDALLGYFYFSDDYDLLDEEALYLMNDLDDKKASPVSATLTAGVKGSMFLAEC